MDYYTNNEPKGEYVLVLSGADKSKLVLEEQLAWQQMSLEEHMNLYLEQGIDKKEAMKKVAKDRGITKRDVYQALLEE